MRLFLLAIMFLFATSAGSPAQAACADAAINIRAPGLAASDRKEFDAQFRRSLRRICRWWGETFEGPFEIEIDESRGPAMALVPAWRGKHGRILFRAGTVRLGRATITHEIVHVLAPNANRFLAEGLAVYAHETQRGQPAYPNFGRDLNSEARKLVDHADLATLERVATPTRLQTPDLDGRSAYIVAGSFVGFLIKERGLDKFRELYALTPLVAAKRNPGAPERWQAIYEVEFATLVAEWRAAIGK